MIQRRFFLAATFVAAAAILRPHPAAAAACESLTGNLSATTTIVSATSVAATSGPASLPAYCSVIGYVTTPGVDHETSNKDNFEVDLPATGWNGKLFFSGGGGFIGGFHELSPLNQGYASAYTDTGHTALTGFDARWATDKTKKIDYFYRGIHVATDAAKATIVAFYGRAAGRAYFVGCSTGGNQAFGEAQRYPSDYDGIIGGDPAIDYSNLMLQFSWNQRHLLQSVHTYVPAAKLPVIAKAVLASCPAVDGGLLVDPRTCRFRPAQIQCPGADGPTCLTADQVATLEKLLQGPVTSDTHQFIFPGDPIGYEDAKPNGLDPTTWEFGLVSPVSQAGGTLTYTDYFANLLVPAEFSYQDQYLKYLGYPQSNPSFNWRSFDFTTAAVSRFNAFGRLHDEVNPDLSAFRAHNGKLLSYNGWTDHVVTPYQIIGYYDAVVNLNGSAETDKFFRLFMVPGMDHCFAGPGPNLFGQAYTSGGPLDPDHNIVSALDRWVEKGIAPDTIIATKYDGDNAANRVLRTYPLCRYPLEARWTKSGNVNDARNYRCVPGPHGNGYADRY